MLQLKKSDYDKILSHAVQGLPNEACGLIAGVVENDIKKIEEVIFLQI